MATLITNPPGFFGSVIAHRVHGVIVILGVGRIDGDERQLAPILASGEPCRLGRFRLRQRGGRKYIRDRVGVDGDQADRALGLQRAQPLGDARARETVAAAACRHLDRDQVAVRASPPAPAGIASSRPSCFLSIGSSRPPPPGAARKMPITRCLPRSMSLMTRPRVTDRLVLVAAVLDPQQDAVADAGDLVRPRAARNPNADLGGGAVLGLVPFGRNRDQLAVTVARRDVGDDDIGKRSWMVQLLAALLDAALVREFAQHGLERGAVGVLQTEGARDLARADFSGLLADEGDDVVFGGKWRICCEGVSWQRPEL